MKSSFILNVDTVKHALTKLRQLPIHPTFPAYLCLKNTAREAGRDDLLKPKFKDFFNTYLYVSDGTDQKPYIVPFTENGSLNADIWFNKNVAGSYAPSSIRDQSPVRKVCAIKSDKTFALKSSHVVLARQHMLYGRTLDPRPLVIFLYRNFEFVGEAPKLSDLIDIFRDEFGFQTDEKNSDNGYAYIFSEELDLDYESNLFISKS